MSQRIIELIRGGTGFELPFASGNWVLLKETGYSPVELLVGAIGGCGAYVYESILTKSKIPFTFERSTMQYQRDETRKSSPLKAVALDFYVAVPPEFQDRAQRALRLVNDNCPVMQSLDPGIVVTERVHFI